MINYEQNKLFLLGLIEKGNQQIPNARIINSKNPELLNDINEFWPENLIPASFGEKVYHYLYPESTICKHGNHKSYSSFRLGYAACGTHCACAKEQKKSTMVERYGVEHPLQSVELKEKMKNTLVERYGEDNLNAAFREQRKKTNLERYGVEHPLQSKDIRDKSKETVFCRYGVHTPFELEHVKKASAECHSKRDRSNQNLKNRLLHPDWYDKEHFVELLKTNSRQQVSEILGCSLSLVEKRISEWELDDFRGTASYYENLISEFLTSLGLEYQKNNRTLIKPKEIDFYIPSNSLAIEFNGLHWHSESFGRKDRNYHLDKSKLCTNAGVHLVHIFQDEWDNHPETVKSIIHHYAGFSANKYAARKLELVSLSSKQADEFIGEHHLQGNTIGVSHRYGLFCKHDGLLAAMTFKTLSKKDRVYEMSRYCVKPFITVQGGASRLLSQFKQEIGTGASLVTYSDNRYFKGSVYPAIGFQYVHQTKPNYWYFKSANRRYHRLNFTKKILVEQGFPEDKSEWEIMQSIGWDRIWDCGNTKWQLTT